MNQYPVYQNISHVSNERVQQLPKQFYINHSQLARYFIFQTGKIQIKLHPFIIKKCSFVTIYAHFIKTYYFVITELDIGENNL